MFERLRQNLFLWHQGPMIVWAAALFIQSSIPGDNIPEWSVLSHDKIIHFLIYIVFAVTVHRGIRNQQRFPLLAQHHWIATVVIVSVYGASDEFHQYFVPNRSCSVYDWGADSLGAVVYVAGSWLQTKLRSAAS